MRKDIPKRKNRLLLIGVSLLVFAGVLIFIASFVTSFFNAYGDPSLKTYNDVDILIKETQVGKKVRIYAMEGDWNCNSNLPTTCIWSSKQNTQDEVVLHFPFKVFSTNRTSTNYVVQITSVEGTRLITQVENAFTFS